jgi:hypothetical protein
MYPSLTQPVRLSPNTCGGCQGGRGGAQKSLEVYILTGGIIEIYISMGGILEVDIVTF